MEIKITLVSYCDTYKYDKLYKFIMPQVAYFLINIKLNGVLFDNKNYSVLPYVRLCVTSKKIQGLLSPYILITHRQELINQRVNFKI